MRQQQIARLGTRSNWSSQDCNEALSKVPPQITREFSVVSAIVALMISLIVCSSAPRPSVAAPAEKHKEVASKSAAAIQKELRISVKITNSGRSLEETVRCQRRPDGTPRLACRKSDGSILSRGDIVAMNLQRLLRSKSLNRSTSKHCYSNCSGPELFACCDVVQEVEHCGDYYCPPGGVVPDDCFYVSGCWTELVSTHECSVVGTCRKRP